MSDPASGAPHSEGLQDRAQRLHEPILAWYAEHARDLPWRDPSASAWSVLVSEVMLQQTPVARVEPIWRIWMDRWPTPADLAAEPGGEAVRAWGRLGYPRRAVRLHACATAITQQHSGEVPHSEAELLALPGVGAYTAAAVAAFAWGQRTTVVDTNVRRVLARAVSAKALPSPALSAEDTRLAGHALPADRDVSVRWNVAVMELGAVVCTARSPQCGRCPVQDRCAWIAADRPAYDGPARPGQAWHGTDRQCRGQLLQLIRDQDGWLPHRSFVAAWPHEPAQRERCLRALVAEGLIQRRTDPAPTDSKQPAAGSRELQDADCWYGFAVD